MKVDESNYETLQKASNITFTDYEIKWFDAENINGYIEVDSLLSMIEDLICEIEHLQEKYEDLQQNMKENYKWVGTCEPDWHDIQEHKPSWWVDRW